MTLAQINWPYWALNPVGAGIIVLAHSALWMFYCQATDWLRGGASTVLT